jgi:hypothetical protein
MSVVLATPAIRRLRCTYPADPYRLFVAAESCRSITFASAAGELSG